MNYYIATYENIDKFRRNRKKGLKIGVTGITITHNSHGLSEITEDWKVGQQYFLEQQKVGQQYFLEQHNV
jgi:hypothetical protein